MKHFFQICFALLPSLALGQVGNPAPNFTVTDTHGDTHTLYQYLDSGKVVVLDFFYTTCIPCQYYSPQVNLAYEKYGCNTANVIFMSIDYNDTNAEVLAYDQEYNIKFPSVSGLNGGGNAVVNLYDIEGFPTFYLIDSSKTIIEHITPPTLQVFDFRFAQHGILPAECISAAHENVRNQNLQIFPNPVGAGSEVSLRFSDDVLGECSYKIFNALGQVAQEGVLLAGEASQPTLSVAQLSPGVYFLNLIPLEGGSSYSAALVVE